MKKRFHQLNLQDRIKVLRAESHLSQEDVDILLSSNKLPNSISENLIENSIGYFQIPFGIARNFIIDGKPLNIPMAVEETSIIAAASSTAKWVNTLGGKIKTRMDGKLIIGQIQIPKIKNLKSSLALLKKNQSSLIKIANSTMPSMIKRGGGVKSLQFRVIPRTDSKSSMLVIHVLCDPCDAMGANMINQVCESLKPEIEKLTQEQIGLCILSNLVDSKLAVAEVQLKNIDPIVAKGIVEAYLFAKHDPYRATTHNKGVMNGIDPILIATGNDWRAVEAGAHAFSSMTGRYIPLTEWKYKNQTLTGSIRLPMAVGIAGGVTAVHPVAKIAIKMLKIKKAEELGRICAAVGLIQNLGALKALSTVGIVRGHMQLHARNLAIAAGAEPEEIIKVAEKLSEILNIEKRINLTTAKLVLKEVRAELKLKTELGFDQ